MPRSAAKVISEGLNVYLCKPLWNGTGEGQQSEISTRRNDSLLIFGQGLGKQQEQQKRKTNAPSAILRYLL